MGPNVSSTELVEERKLIFEDSKIETMVKHSLNWNAENEYQNDIGK